MAVIGTFGSFTAARLGIYASQSSLNVTGNNIANINTKGYTRQRADLVSLHSAGNSRYHNGFNLDIGYGVLVDSVSQLRDPYLDIRFRDEQAYLGAFEAKVKGLQQISSILDEVGKGKDEFGIIERQFNDFLQQLQNLNNRVNDQTYDTTVRSSAESLVRLFNSYADALTRVKDNQLEELQGDVKSVNTILTEIRDLNEQIRNANIYGDKALELRDTRNVLIDDLSKYIKIDVRYTMEPIDQYSEVEKLIITIGDSGNPPTELVNGIYATQIDMPEMAQARNPDYDPDLPTSNRYISQDSTPGNIKYTDNAREALRNAAGALITNDDPGEALIKQMTGFETGISGDNMYGKGPAGTAEKYLDKDGNPTDDPEQAAMVENAVMSVDKKNLEENRLWMSLRPLTDKKGRYMRDKNDREIKETVDLGDNDLYGALQTKRELLTEEGEFASKADIAFDPDANIKRGIPYYQHALDALARQFAETFNEANTVGTNPDGTPKKVLVGYETEIKNGVEVYKTVDTCLLGTYDTYKIKSGPYAGRDVDLTNYHEQQKWVDLPSDMPADVQTAIKELQEEHLSSDATVAGALGHGYPITAGGILFSVSGDSNDTTVKDKDGKDTGIGITAANISISKDWALGSTRLLSSKNYNIKDNSTANDNIYHMIELMGETKFYKAKDIEDLVPDAANNTDVYFKGTYQQYLANMNTILSSDQETATIQYNGYEGRSLDLDNQRQSVSGVDLNDEATNMMMYQKSYAAACQLMTTLDSMLDKLINGTLR